MTPYELKKDPKIIKRLLEADKEPIDERGMREVATCEQYKTGCGRFVICWTLDPYF